MIRKVCLALGCMLVLVVVGFAQTTRDVAPKPPKPAYQAVKKAKKKPFLKRIFHKEQEIKTGQEEILEFRERMAANSKRKAKIAKKSATPQYEDPLYFGHKKPPKKRPNGKKKFCKECGLYH
ncbi:MAG: hypothetical protein ACI83W_000699 [Marinoscillum sp.]|jgi:hypothetical protein